MVFKKISIEHNFFTMSKDYEHWPVKMRYQQRFEYILLNVRKYSKCQENVNMDWQAFTQVYSVKR